MNDIRSKFFRKKQLVFDLFKLAKNKINKYHL